MGSFVGEVIQCARPHGYALDTAVIFDWRNSGGDSKADLHTPPSFAYILPYDDRTLFVEETVLVADDKAQLDGLDNRLQHRKLLLGIGDHEVIGAQERYSFPMGGALPTLHQRTVALGGAARMVHPATGYCFAYTLNVIPSLVQTMLTGLRGGQHLDSVAASCWAGLWTQDRLRLHTIYSMGSDVLVTLDRSELGLFFDAFFKIPSSKWMPFLTRANTTRELVLAMLVMFFQSPLVIKARLAYIAVTCGGLPVVSAVAGGVLLPNSAAKGNSL